MANANKNNGLNPPGKIRVDTESIYGHEPGRLALMARGVWAIASLFLANRLADNYLLLVWLYGFARVHREGLHFTCLPGGKSIADAIVSNGDHIAYADRFMGFPLTIGAWLVLWLPGVLLIGWLSRWRKRARWAKAVREADLEI